METTLEKLSVEDDLLTQVDSFSSNNKYHAKMAHSYIDSITQMPLRNQIDRIKKFTLPFLRQRNPNLDEDLTLAYTAAAVLTAQIERVRRTETELLLRAMEVLDERYDAGF